jgi:hypothetical protein
VGSSPSVDPPCKRKLPWAPSGRRCWREYVNRMNWDLMRSIWLVYLYCRMAENQPRIRRTVLFVNLSSFSSCRNLGSSEPTLHLPVIHPSPSPRTDIVQAIFTFICNISDNSTQHAHSCFKHYLFSWANVLVGKCLSGQMSF